MDLLKSWAAWAPTSTPYVLDADRTILLSDQSLRSTVVTNSWKDAIERHDFCAEDDPRLHLGVLPEPFTGNLGTASIFILLLNPGLGPTDYYGEYEVPAFREARLRNLRQEFTRDRLAFCMLDPQFAWHGGFQWWHGKLRAVIGELSKRHGVTFAAARHGLAKELASIELFPYHSATFNRRGKWLRDLRSVQLAREFVRDVVLPRVARREAIVIATRKVTEWGLPEAPGVIRYEAKHARGAHITPNSAGGAAILKHFERRPLGSVA